LNVFAVLREVEKLRLTPVAKGLLTFVPGIDRVYPRRGTGGTDSASYCYEVWIKHLTLLWENGMRSMPETVAELGPGDSLGVGLAALLSGVKQYYALDVIQFSNPARNLEIFEQLVQLFKARAPRPSRGWPDYDAYLDEDLFPHHILSEELLQSSLREERLNLIRRALADPDFNGEVSIRYMSPWYDEAVIERDSVDLIWSHAVLEHVADLDKTYAALRLWLKPGAVMSHQIDFASHGLTAQWNGHLGCSDLMWKVIVGKRPFLINRQPCSAHLELMERHGFEISCCLKSHRADGIARPQLSSRWKALCDDDLTCSSVFVQARKAVLT
jgi:SAM-dependent methyltransferase